jgi:peptidoglycan/LPS O-acetylase OafA/YrhL
LRFALPAGAVLGAATLTAYLAVADVHGHDQLQGRTAAVTVFVFVGLYLLLVLEAERMQASRRYAAEVVALAACLGGGFLAMLGSEDMREFFALAVPGLWSVIVIVIVSVAAAWLLGRLGLSPYRFNTVPDPAAKAERST